MISIFITTENNYKYKTIYGSNIVRTLSNKKLISATKNTVKRN